MLDAMGLCIFVAFPVLDIPEAFDAIDEMVAAHTGELGTRTRSCARQGDAHVRAPVQRARRLHGCRRPPAGVLQDGAAASAQRRVHRDRRGTRLGLRLRAGDCGCTRYFVASRTCWSGLAPGGSAVRRECYARCLGAGTRCVRSARSR